MFRVSMIEEVKLEVHTSTNEYRFKKNRIMAPLGFDFHMKATSEGNVNT